MGHVVVGGVADPRGRGVGGAQAREVGAFDETSQLVEHGLRQLELAPPAAVLSDDGFPVALDDEPRCASRDRPGPEEVDEGPSVGRGIGRRRRDAADLAADEKPDGRERKDPAKAHRLQLA